MFYSSVGETTAQEKKRAEEILKILKRTYPRAKIVLNYNNPWELLVAVVLSAQCTDKVVNKVTEALFTKAQNARPEDDQLLPEKLKSQNYNLKFKSVTPKLEQMIYFAEVELSELEQDIKSTGFYRNKAKNIKEAARIILEKHNGEVPRTMEDLISLPGVARKTANIILGNAYNIVEGIAVDTHVSRISQRLRLVDLDKIGKGKERTFKRKGQEVLDFKTGANTDRIEQQLMEIIPKKDWFKFTYLLIDHGRTLCTSRNPSCFECPLTDLCPASRI